MQTERLTMSTSDSLGGIIHTYQKFDPVNFPSPTAPPPDLVSPAFEHLLHYGSMRHLTEEELANAVHLHPSQIRGLGPSLESLMAMLRERKRKILETYETEAAQNHAHRNFHGQAEKMRPPSKKARILQGFGLVTKLLLLAEIGVAGLPCSSLSCLGHMENAD